MKVLGIEKGSETKTKEEMVKKILDFLMAPYDHGKKIPEKKSNILKILHQH